MYSVNDVGGTSADFVERLEEIARRTKELAAQLCKLPQGAMRTDKQAALMGYGRPLEEGLRIEAEVGQTVLDSFDITEGSSSFVEKRKPSFKQDG